MISSLDALAETKQLFITIGFITIDKIKRLSIYG